MADNIIYLEPTRKRKEVLEAIDNATSSSEDGKLYAVFSGDWYPLSLETTLNMVNASNKITDIIVKHELPVCSVDEFLPNLKNNPSVSHIDMGDTRMYSDEILLLAELLHDNHNITSVTLGSDVYMQEKVRFALEDVVSRRVEPITITGSMNGEEFTISNCKEQASDVSETVASETVEVENTTNRVKQEHKAEYGA